MVWFPFLLAHQTQLSRHARPCYRPAGQARRCRAVRGSVTGRDRSGRAARAGKEDVMSEAGPYVRTVKTASGATAVQTVCSSHRGSRDI